MKYWILSLFVLCIALSAHSQNAYRLSGKSIPALRFEAQEAILSIPSTPQTGLVPLAVPSTHSYPSLKSYLTVSEAPKAWRYCDLGLFCKLEVRMEKAVKFPVKLRLGETQQVERMEGKLGDGAYKSHK